METAIIKNGNEFCVTDNDYILQGVLKSLAYNNTFCPNPERVIYNLGKNEVTDEYTLATTVFFKDKTKVTVKNSINDKIGVTKETIKLSDGSTKEVETATVESREVGLVYAILKRMVCQPDTNGNIQGTGFANFLRKTVKRAWNQPVEDAKTKFEKAIKKASLNKENKAKNEDGAKKNDKSSLRKCVNDLSEIIKKLGDKIS